MPNNTTPYSYKETFIVNAIAELIEETITRISKQVKKQIDEAIKTYAGVETLSETQQDYADDLAYSRINYEGCMADMIGLIYESFGLTVPEDK